MMDESKKETIVHYFVLVAMLVVGIFGVIFFSGQKDVQVIVIALMAIGYVMWGVFHHFVHNDFHPKVFFEYLFVAAIGVLPVFALLMQR